ncbi:IS110 family RNA-guided transposase [Streptomyces gibsoniae]|uniref:IS110 family transposase n=1 Tax=Streptomyces gibsoniae TaxID=3075529 RepID=A0ABU2TRD1_9ACTN|nr:IS110 family transposase [Streptomyces sp. DSM 41699]MDT0463422.1 IS110 family transposase [Streptomyces sp. DSM 41699]
MERIVERPAGLDVHKDVVVAEVHLPGGAVEQGSFATTTPGLLVLRDWLVGHGVTRVGIESTGVYWKCVYYMLEDDMEVWLLNARHMRNIPGRKTDVADASWICQLIEFGLVRPSFVPPKPIRELRNLTRYRKAQIEERTRETQRLDKILQDAGVKLSSVASDVLGKSGRAMLRALVDGTTDPEVLADLAIGRLRAKLPALREALTSRFSGHHALLVAAVLSKLDFLDELIGRLSAEIEEAVAPFARQVELLDTVPGIDLRTAQGLLAEFGADMSVFGTASRFASWAAVCPGNHESAGRKRSGRSRKGPRWLAIYLHDAAMGAIRTKNTYLAAQYSRLRPRLGHAKALVATEHSILVSIFHMLTRDQAYHDLGGDYFQRRNDPARQARRLIGQLEALGYHVQAEPAPATP